MRLWGARANRYRRLRALPFTQEEQELREVSAGWPAKPITHPLCSCGQSAHRSKSVRSPVRPGLPVSRTRKGIAVLLLRRCKLEPRMLENNRQQLSIVDSWCRLGARPRIIVAISANSQQHFHRSSLQHAPWTHGKLQHGRGSGQPGVHALAATVARGGGKGGSSRREQQAGERRCLCTLDRISCIDANSNTHPCRVATSGSGQQPAVGAGPARQRSAGRKNQRLTHPSHDCSIVLHHLLQAVGLNFA